MNSLDAKIGSRDEREYMDRMHREARRLSDSWRARIGQSIRRVRTLRGITQGDLAALVGADISTISKTELGKTVPDFATIETIADILSVSLDDLVGREAITPLAETVSFFGGDPRLNKIETELLETRAILARLEEAVRSGEIVSTRQRKAENNG